MNENVQPGSYSVNTAFISSVDATDFDQVSQYKINNASSTENPANYGFNVADGENYYMSTFTANISVATLKNMSANVEMKGPGTDDKWVAPTSDFNTVPSTRGEEVEMRVSITNAGNTTFDNIRLYNVLPYDGYNGSTGTIEFLGVKNEGGSLTNATIWYTSMNSNSLPKYSGGESFDLGSQSFGAPNWSTTQPENTTGIYVEFGTQKVSPGETLEVVLVFKVPDVENKQVAINQFAYSAETTGVSTTYISPSAGFSTETISLNYNENIPSYTTATVDPTTMPGSVFSTLGRDDGKISVSNMIPVLEDCTFLGWNTAADGSGTDYSGGDIIDYKLESSISVTLYAKWRTTFVYVTFDDNNGTGNTTDVKVGYGKSLAAAGEDISDYTPSRTGYEFKGWTTVKDDESKAFTKDTTLEEDTTVYALWEAEERTITLSPNYVGAPAADTKTITTNYDAEISPSIASAWSVPSRTGYTFLRWDTKDDGTGSKFDVGSTIDPEGTTVYAKWQINNYTVDFDTQNGEPKPAQQTVQFDDYITRPADPKPARGHSFIAWYTEPVGGSAWNFVTDTMPGEDITLYAHYEVNKYVVTFDPNNGGAKQYKNVLYDQLIPQIENPKLYGYTFLGWYDENGNLFDFANTKMSDVDITLTAKWEHTKYAVTYLDTNLQVAYTYGPIYAGDLVPYKDGPVLGGYTFRGWNVEGSDSRWYFNNPMPDNNLTLVARYDRDSTDPTDSSTVITSGSTSRRPPTSQSGVSSASSEVTSQVPSEIASQSSISSSAEISSSPNSQSNTVISNSEVALVTVSSEKEWSLISLVATVINVILSVVLLIFMFKKENSKIWGIIGILIGIIALILFFILNTLTGIMVLFSPSTIIFIAAVILQLIAFLLFMNSKKDTEQAEED